MRTVLRNWKIIVVVVLTLSLFYVIFKNQQLNRKLEETLAAARVHAQLYEENKVIIADYKKMRDSLELQIAKSKVIVITKTDIYEKSKNGSIDINVGDPELLRQLKEFRARYKTGE